MRNFFPTTLAVNLTFALAGCGLSSTQSSGTPPAPSMPLYARGPAATPTPPSKTSGVLIVKVHVFWKDRSGNEQDVEVLPVTVGLSIPGGTDQAKRSGTNLEGEVSFPFQIRAPWNTNILATAYADYNFEFNSATQVYWAPLSERGDPVPTQSATVDLEIPTMTRRVTATISKPFDEVYFEMAGHGYADAHTEPSNNKGVATAVFTYSPEIPGEVHANYGITDSGQKPYRFFDAAINIGKF